MFYDNLRSNQFFEISPLDDHFKVCPFIFLSFPLKAIAVAPLFHSKGSLPPPSPSGRPKSFLGVGRMVLYLFLIAPLFPRDWLTGRGRTSGRETSDMRGEEPRSIGTERQSEAKRGEGFGPEAGSGVGFCQIVLHRQ